MRTRDALQQLTGQTYEYGDGPLGQVGRQLLANFQAQETARLAAADERAHMAGQGPILDALRRRLVEARAASLCNDATPCVTRFEAVQALKRARSQHPTDRGLQMATAHAERLWHKNSMGVLTVGDVARLRTHYSAQFPRSVVARVIDSEIPKVGFNTLAVSKLAPLVAQIQGSDEASRQHAYEQVVRAHGLAGDKPEQLRARAFLREMADLAAEERQAQAPGAGGEAAAQRLMARMAAHDDPILSRVGQLDTESAPALSPMQDAGPDALPPVEEEIPHDEATEELAEVVSPNSGEPLVLELGVGESTEASPELDMPEAPMTGAEELTPGVMASLQHFGQLDDYAADDPLMDAPAGGGGADTGDQAEALDGMGVPMLDDAPDASSAVLPDPTAPGESVQVTVEPANELGDMDEEDLLAGGDSGSGSGVTSLPSMETAARRARRARRGRRGRVFQAYVVQAGVIYPEPLERVQAPHMAAMLRHVAQKMREASDSQTQSARHVWAQAQNFQHEVLIELDRHAGNYICVRAEEAPVFNVDVPATGQPVVQHNLAIDEGDGLSVLLDDAELHQNAPAALGEEGEGEHKSGQQLSAAQVKQICARYKLDAARIEAKVLAGEKVRAGSMSLVLDDDGDIILRRGKRGRKASLMHLDTVIRDFMTLAAAQAVKSSAHSRAASAAATVPAPTYQVRQLFTVDCGRCASHSEYVMPNRPENVRCGSCGWVTPAEAVAIQLEARHASVAFPGYVISTTVPDGHDRRKHRLVAKRMLRAIKQVVHTDGAKIRQGRLEVTARGVDDAALARVRRVLEDVFGVRDIVAQQVAPSVNTLGQPMQHATTPPPAVAQAQPAGPSVQPVQPVQPGAGMQQATMEQYADPMAAPGLPTQAQRHASLPAGPGIKHVLVQHQDGQQQWMPVEAASDHMARTVMASYMEGSQILQIVDSLQRGAQAMPLMPDAAPAPGPEVAGPAEDMGMQIFPMPGEGENIETASIDPQVEETIKAAMLHYRNTGVGIAEATDNFVNNYSKFLDRYGDKTSPARHLIEAAVIRVAKEVYEKPALVQQAPRFSAALDQLRRKHNWHVREARRLQADKPKGPQPSKINQQQDDYVSLPGAGELLGPDSDTYEQGGPEPKKINQQIDPMKQPGASSSDTATQPDSSARDPGDFGAGKGYDPSGHVTFDGPGWGQSWSDTNLGKDTQTGDNATTRSMDSLSSGAYSNVRSK